MPKKRGIGHKEDYIRPQVIFVDINFHQPPQATKTYNNSKTLIPMMSLQFHFEMGTDQITVQAV